MTRQISRPSHGELAAPVVVNGTSYQVSPACATCHAREYCVTCHVNAPEVPEIQALRPDPRSLAMKEAKIKAPASHEAPAFLTTHGRKLSKKDLTLKCGACHTSTSCEACHQVPPQQVRALAVAGPGRGTGATVNRKRPASHGKDFTDGHATLASGVAADLRRLPRPGAVPAVSPPERRDPRADSTPRTTSPDTRSRPTPARRRARIATIQPSSARPVTRRTASCRTGGSSEARRPIMTATRPSPSATDPLRARAWRVASAVTPRRTAWCATLRSAGGASIRTGPTSPLKSCARPIRRCARPVTPNGIPSN